MESLNYKPIGVFKCDQSYKYEAPRQPSDDKSDLIGWIRLKQGVENFAQALKGLEGFERIWLLYEFHRNQNWKPMTRTPRATAKQGVFATRAPYRPNPIGLSCVKLIRVEGLKVFVKEFDLLNDTPVLDIKPYIPSCDRYDVINHSWLEEGVLTQITYSELFLKQNNWLKRRGEALLQPFVEDQLKRDPLNRSKKRVHNVEGNLYCLCYRLWRVFFTYSLKEQRCHIERIATGYTLDELYDLTHNPHGHKPLHLNYFKTFLMGKD